MINTKGFEQEGHTIKLVNDSLSVDKNCLYLSYVFEFRSHLSQIDLKTKEVKTIILDPYEGNKLPYIYAGALCLDKNRLVSYLT